jgi:hypothetical protein
LTVGFSFGKVCRMTEHLPSVEHEQPPELASAIREHSAEMRALRETINNVQGNIEATVRNLLADQRPRTAPLADGSASRRNRQPLFMRIYSQRVLTDVVRAIGYEALSAAEAQKRLEPLFE